MPDDNSHPTAPVQPASPPSPAPAPTLTPAPDQPLFPLPTMDAINAGLNYPRGIELRERR